MVHRSWSAWLAAALVLGACDRRSAPAEPPRGAQAGDTAVAQTGFGVHHALTTAGVRRAELRADTALFDDAATRIELRGVHVVLYSTNGDSVGVLAAPAATYDLRARRVALRGGVTSLVAGRRTSTPTAVYDAAVGRVVDDAAAAAAPQRAASAARP